MLENIVELFSSVEGRLTFATALGAVAGTASGLYHAYKRRKLHNSIAHDALPFLGTSSASLIIVYAISDRTEASLAAGATAISYYATSRITSHLGTYSPK